MKCDDNEDNDLYEKMTKLLYDKNQQEELLERYSQISNDDSHLIEHTHEEKNKSKEKLRKTLKIFREKLIKENRHDIFLRIDYCYRCGEKCHATKTIPRIKLSSIEVIRDYCYSSSSDSVCHLCDKCYKEIVKKIIDKYGEMF